MASLIGNRLVHRDELGAVGKRRLDLDIGDHLRHAVHHVGALEQRGAVAHQLGHAAAVACALHDRGADEGHGLRVVELQPAGAAALGQQRSGEDQQLVLLAR
jgi:hypothetical protein